MPVNLSSAQAPFAALFAAPFAALALPDAFRGPRGNSH